MFSMGIQLIDILAVWRLVIDLLIMGRGSEICDVGFFPIQRQ